MTTAEIQLNDPQTLYRRWEEQQWSPFDIELARDREQWPRMGDGDRGLFYWALSSLMVAEERITTKFSGLVAAPCGAPVMAAILTWVAATRSALLGFAYLLSFSMGMCSLLLVAALATDTSLRLPRAGPWMLWVKRAFALILLGVAEYYLIQMGMLLT